MDSLVKKDGSLKKTTTKAMNGSLNMSMRNLGKKQTGTEWDTLVVLADVSGSMCDHIDSNQTKIEAEKDALTNMLVKGQEGQQVLIVEFPGEHIVDEVGVSQLTNDTQYLKGIINGMSTRGMTPMYAALQAGYLRTGDCNPRFVLMSDGQPNDNHYNEDDILKLVKDKGVTIDVVGIGDPKAGNYDPVFLKRIADLTGGIYAEVTNYAQFIKTLYTLSPAQRKQITDGKSKPIAL